MTEAGRPLVTLYEIMFIHTVQRDRYGGGIGIRDQGLIESALARPLAAFGGKELYTTPYLRAAALWHGLIRNHGFVDANKRTATMAMQWWLFREGYELEATDADLVAAAKDIANKRLALEGAAAWIEQHSHAIPPESGESPPSGR